MISSFCPLVLSLSLTFRSLSRVLSRIVSLLAACLDLGGTWSLLCLVRPHGALPLLIGLLAALVPVLFWERETVGHSGQGPGAFSQS